MRPDDRGVMESDGRAAVPGVTLSVVIVTWNSAADIGRCLASLRRAAGTRAVEVVVVDNASTDRTLEAVRAFPEARCVASPRNLGFAGGSNRGAEEARGSVILLLNPDTEVAPEAIERLLDRLEETSGRLAAVGPVLLNADGSTQSAGERFLTPREYLLRRVLLLPKPACKAEGPYPVEWASGACLAIRRAAWEAVGPLDESFFLYAEDMEWCWRARRAGWRVEIVPGARVVHFKGASIRQNRKQAILSNAANTVRWFRLSGGPRAAARGSLAVALGLLARAAAALAADRRAARINLECAWSVLRGAPGVGGAAWACRKEDDSRPIA